MAYQIHYTNKREQKTTEKTNVIIEIRTSDLKFQVS